MENEGQAFRIISLISKFQNDAISPEEEAELQAWISQSKENELLFEQLNDEQYRATALLQLQAYDPPAAWQRVLNKREQQTRRIAKRGRIRKLLLPISAVAACLLLATFLFLYRGKILNWIHPVTEQTIVTTTGQRKIIELADGSKVWLSPQSALTYPNVFQDSNRNIRLKGEAFFEVAKDKIHPFIIRSGAITTRVVGTSFNVQAYDHENSSVSVLTGIVTVSATQKDKGTLSNVRLTPFQKVVFDKNTHLLSKQPFPEAKTLLLRKDGIYQYAGTPVLRIIADLQKEYNIQIEVHGDLSNCTFYGTQTSQDNIYQFLKKLCLTINARIERNGNTIIITGDGC